jgi:hypothetical protein
MHRWAPSCTLQRPQARPGDSPHPAGQAASARLPARTAASQAMLACLPAQATAGQAAWACLPARAQPRLTPAPWHCCRATTIKLTAISRSTGHAFTHLDRLYLALGWGYGQGVVHVLFFFGSILPLTAGHGTLYSAQCPGEAEDGRRRAGRSVALLAAAQCSRQLPPGCVPCRHEHLPGVSTVRPRVRGHVDSHHGDLAGRLGDWELGAHRHGTRPAPGDRAVGEQAGSWGSRGAAAGPRAARQLACCVLRLSRLLPAAESAHASGSAQPQQGGGAGSTGSAMPGWRGSAVQYNRIVLLQAPACRCTLQTLPSLSYNGCIATVPAVLALGAASSAYAGRLAWRKGGSWQPTTPTQHLRAA